MAGAAPVAGRRAVIVVFGAAVWADGRPSPSLLRRIGYAHEAARAEPEALIFCSGAAGRYGPSEASVMAETLMARGVTPERLVLDEASRDTLQSAAAAARFVRAHGPGRCIVCSDHYHLARIMLLLRLLGVRAERGPIPRGPGGARLRTWARMSAREALALPYDAALALTQRRRLLRD